MHADRPPRCAERDDRGTVALDPAHPWRSALEAVRFLLELALLAGVALAGASTGAVIAVAAPVAVATLWGALVAPKAARRLGDPLRLALELALFVGAGAWLTATGRPVAGLALTAASAAVAVALRLTGSAA